jgi:DNA-binding GntR family transcriptional regulator
VRHLGLTEKVYEEIKEKIIGSQFPEGFRLAEDILIKEIGTSKTPIKIALAKLEQEGFVQTIPRRGTYVIDLTPEIMIEMYSFREELEGFAARLAAKNLSSSEIKKLEKNLCEFDPNKHDITLSRYLELDRSFHLYILEGAKNRHLKEALKGIFDKISMYKFKSASVRQSSGKPYIEHMKILEGIKNKNHVMAEKAMRFHIRRAIETLETQLFHKKKSRKKGELKNGIT